MNTLKTDHLDLWQVHEVIYDNDPELHFAKGGVIEALEEAGARARCALSGSRNTNIQQFI